MDTEGDYTVAKSIVQSGQLDEEWDSIRQGKGIWPVEKETWKQFRAYSMQELKDEMKIYKQSKGNMNFHAFHKISWRFSAEIFILSLLSDFYSSPFRPLDIHFCISTTHQFHFNIIIVIISKMSSPKVLG